jgi:hypothetical protein
MVRVNNGISKVFTFGQRQSCQGYSSIPCHIDMPLVGHIFALIEHKKNTQKDHELTMAMERFEGNGKEQIQEFNHEYKMRTNVI